MTEKQPKVIADQVKKLKPIEVDEAIAKEVFGMKKSVISYPLKSPDGRKIGMTNWTDRKGKPAVMPPISQDANCALYFVQALRMNLISEYCSAAEAFRTVDQIPHRVHFDEKTFPLAVAKMILFTARFEKEQVETKGD